MERFAELFADHGVDGQLYAVDLRTGRAVGWQADLPAQPASVAKVALLTAVARAHDAGTLSFGDAVEIPAGDRTPGSTGLSALTDAARLTVRDLATLMITISDNHATDVLFGLVAPEAVTKAMAELGHPAFRVESTARELLDDLDAAVDPETSPWSTTARATAELFRDLWADRAASPGSCAEIRRMLRAQVISRLAAGFPEEDTVIGSKTGTVLDRLNEAGVVESADGHAVAVAVFTRSTGANSDPGRAIATAARTAFDALRGEVS